MAEETLVSGWQTHPLKHSGVSHHWERSGEWFTATCGTGGAMHESKAGFVDEPARPCRNCKGLLARRKKHESEGGE